MKQRCKVGLVPAVLALLCFSGPVRAGDQIPFKATFTGIDRVTFFPPTCKVIVQSSNEGEATHLGRFTDTSTTITPESTIRLELTEAQKEQVRKATGRVVDVLELRLQGLPESAEGPEGAPCFNNPAGQDTERMRPGSIARLRPAHHGKEKKEK